MQWNSITSYRGPQKKFERASVCLNLKTGAGRSSLAG